MKSVRTYLSVFVVFAMIFVSCSKDELKDLNLKQPHKATDSQAAALSNDDKDNQRTGQINAELLNGGDLNDGNSKGSMTVDGGHDGGGSTGSDPGGVVGGDENEGDDDGDGIIGGDENDGDDDDEIIGGTVIIVGSTKSSGEKGGK